MRKSLVRRRTEQKRYREVIQRAPFRGLIYSSSGPDKLYFTAFDDAREEFKQQILAEDVKRIMDATTGDASLDIRTIERKAT